jgi:LPS sulfotransferase NodH
MIRVFIVGCPRSGTTLLQCLIAAHSQMISFPESHLHYDLSQAGDRLQEFDNLARRYNLSGWIEKTPRHLHFIPEITVLCPDLKFIHCLRNAKANIAALYTIERRHGTAWNYRPKTIEECYQRWVDDRQISNSYQYNCNHKLIAYENLVENSVDSLQDLCKFLGIEYEPQMLENYPQIAPQVDEGAPWKASVRQSIQNYNATNLSYLLPDELQLLEQLCQDLP